MNTLLKISIILSIYFVFTTSCKHTPLESIDVNTIDSISTDTCNIVSATTTDAECSVANGSIIIMEDEGSTGYSYSLDGITYQESNIFSSLAVGSYTYYVKDNTSCIATGNTIIMDNGSVSFTYDTTNVTCGLTDGSITITTTGGDAPFEYSIDNGSTFQVGSTFTNLAVGDYNVIVKDNAGCSAAAQITVNQAATTLSFSSNIVDANCGTTDGQITVTGSGGGGGYTYSIDGGSFSGSNSFISLAEGTYTISIKDVNNCETSNDVTVGVNSASPSYSACIAPILANTCTSTSCHGGTGTAAKPNLQSYANVSANAATIKAELNAGTMPKSGSLSNANKELIINWIDAGALNN